MSGTERPLRIAVIAGEESGDLLGADLVAAIKATGSRPVELVGVGGRHLESQGLVSLFPPSEIALMGVSAVLFSLPRLISRIGQTARAIVAAKPDCLITIDSPEFNLRVAKAVRRAAPNIPIIKYVCPSVWAWRPSRARNMRPHTDHVLCLLPFEPDALARLDGPPGTYVGHRLTFEPGILAARAAQRAREGKPAAETRTLLVLPGSRRGEVSRLLPAFRETVDLMIERGTRLRVVMPTVPNVRAMVEAGTRDWPVRPEISTEPERKWAAYADADAAIAASGTVLLELALARVPMLSCYKLDRPARLAQFLITVWSAALPNLIADRIVVPEVFNEYARPPWMARFMEQLLRGGHMAGWQREGFDEIERRMTTERPAGEIGAEIVLRAVAERPR